MSNFEYKLKKGKIGESLIANWLKTKGFNILPVYEIEKDQYKGPAVYACDGSNIVAPDLLAFKKNKIVWFEAKHKEAFTWYRKKAVFNTGIDIRHYKEYLRINKLTDWPVWLLFLHRGGQAKDSPKSPSGLYGGELGYLSRNICHESNRYGNSGMVYWKLETLKKLANYKDIEKQRC